MANAVQTADKTTLSAMLEKLTTLSTIKAWIRDYPELVYVGMFLPNMYASGGKMEKGQITIADQKQLAFKQIGSLEGTMSVNANEVMWYEAGVYTEEAKIVANATNATTITTDSDGVAFLKVNDVIRISPGVGSTTGRYTATITAVDTVNKTISLGSTQVTVKAGDRIVFLFNKLAFGAEISRGVSENSAVPVVTYFQKFGESMEFRVDEINQTRLLIDAKNFAAQRFATGINSCNNRFAKAFYTARNIPGEQSETQGLDAVIEEIEARDGTGSAIVDFSGITDSKSKALKLVEVINRAASAPVYNGNEVPTAFCNLQAITSLSAIKFDMANYFTLSEKELEFGIQAYSSPFFRNIQFMVSMSLNKLEPYKSMIYLFPKHLVSFRNPQYDGVDENGALTATKAGIYKLHKVPQVDPDKVKYTASMRIANIFGGQSFPNTYIRIENI